MPVPTYDKLIEPIIRHLSAHPEGVAARDVRKAAAVALGLTEGDRDELLPSGVQPVHTLRPVRVPKLDTDYFDEE